MLYAFTGANDGGDAATGLVLDAKGNLFGTTVVGGEYSCGTVFKLAPQATPPWQESVLDSFDCYSEGKNPYGGVTFGKHAHLYGTTVSGGSGGSCGSSGCGVVFELTASTEKVLHAFTGGNDGFGPGGGVAIDRMGRLYGTTPDGGTYSEGVLYEVLQNTKGWQEKILLAFSGGNDGGVGSLGLLLIDSSGAFYGVTEIGGAYGDGTVFELSATPKNRRPLSTLYAFRGVPDGASPYGGLITDASGDLYGTTYYGGRNGLGCVFELTPKGQGTYRERVLYSFNGAADGSSPTSTLLLGKSGELYGTTSTGGGSCDCGTVFKVNQKSGKEAVLHSFTGGTDGAYPYYGLTKDSSGNFYGTTVAGGSSNQGTVFQLTDR